MPLAVPPLPLIYYCFLSSHSQPQQLERLLRLALCLTLADCNDSPDWERTRTRRAYRVAHALVPRNASTQTPMSSALLTVVRARLPPQRVSIISTQGECVSPAKQVVTHTGSLQVCRLEPPLDSSSRLSSPLGRWLDPRCGLPVSHVVHVLLDPPGALKRLGTSSSSLPCSTTT